MEDAAALDRFTSHEEGPVDRSAGPSYNRVESSKAEGLRAAWVETRVVQPLVPQGGVVGYMTSSSSRVAGKPAGLVENRDCSAKSAAVNGKRWLTARLMTP